MNIINLKFKKLIDLNIDYWIEDLNKNIILKITETKSIGERLEYLAKLQLPLDIKGGEYLLCAKIKGDDIALACNSFEVKSTLFVEEAKEIAKMRGYIILNLSALIAIIILVIIYMYYTYRKLRKIEKIIRIDENDLAGGGALGFDLIKITRGNKKL